MGTTTIVLQCSIAECTAWVKAEYDPGEAMTRDYPGYPPGWIAYQHNNEESHTHLDRLNANELFGNRCDQVAIESWDTYYMMDWYC